MFFNWSINYTNEEGFYCTIYPYISFLSFCLFLCLQQDCVSHAETQTYTCIICMSFALDGPFVNGGWWWWQLFTYSAHVFEFK
jgi:hypothetical protein